MCQRVQKIDGVVEANGRAKFSGIMKPSAWAAPMAMCEYPRSRRRVASHSRRRGTDVWAAPVRGVIEAGGNAIAAENSLSQQFGELHHEHAGGDAPKPACNVVRTRDAIGNGIAEASQTCGRWAPRW